MAESLSKDFENIRKSLFGSAFTKYQLAKRLSDTKLAKIIGVKRQNIEVWRKGKCLPRKNSQNEDITKRIADALGVLEEDLFLSKEKADEYIKSNLVEMGLYIHERWNDIQSEKPLTIVSKDFGMSIEEVEIFFNSNFIQNEIKEVSTVISENEIQENICFDRALINLIDSLPSSKFKTQAEKEKARNYIFAVNFIMLDYYIGKIDWDSVEENLLMYNYKKSLANY